MRGSLLLLSALLLLESTDGNKEYQLGQPETNIIIDKAIKEANERHGKAKHLDFVSILSSDYDKRMLNVLLKPTTCDKTIPFVHRKDCKIQNKATPQVSCVECRGEMSCLLLREQEKVHHILVTYWGQRPHLFTIMIQTFCCQDFPALKGFNCSHCRLNKLYPNV
ncbi:cystatin-like protein isoform X4 [Ctenopharyngodon idella]|uniref:cystatin-like protein isoform X4 n=1 Tax=Ctenopharyngodon idella TaxID=7959 RepID=UPI00223152D8|nr:cystatin-like protein isoform X4 [Ctenopharyngodon idella]